MQLDVTLMGQNEGLFASSYVDSPRVNVTTTTILKLELVLP